MDLDTVREVVVARDREDLAGLGPGTVVLAGGTWLYSEPQDGVERLVDITGLGWTPVAMDAGGLEIAATCTLAQLADSRYPARWTGTALFGQACGALLASHKIRRTATVGGNVCLALPAGAVLAALTALGGYALVWGPRMDRWIPLSQFVFGPGNTRLNTGDMLRAIRIPEPNLRARTAFRKIALAPLGRSGAVVMGRRNLDGSCHLTLSAATRRPVVLEFDEVPGGSELTATIDAVNPRLWYDDPHGSPDWRHHVSTLLAAEVAAELAGGDA
ncbi:FAD binding domain-containing protein [Nocardia huaxiensis]|uniref:FAD binding domain-containing protein n=1 Tax=Nocardia huaxiensis TaxID=2755382 RepID=A0A7D6ZZA6_9NOCA|nr:FAD binding domain-containing protein [Nocardia huaxiensis]QLY32209.1 FAD binding domain-containing protein [Nocardia huaxiensis]UFS94088.1 FAD binding domain-containing protein [Nocardia huaxiensis]